MPDNDQLARMTRRQRVFDLRVQQASWSEVSREIGMSEGTVKADYYRIRFVLLWEIPLLELDLKELM